MGTRALTHLKPYKIWIVTQFDGYPEGLGKDLTFVAKNKLSREEGLKYINEKHEIRAKGKTKSEALNYYLGKKYTPTDYDIWIEYVWAITSDWKVEGGRK